MTSFFSKKLLQWHEANPRPLPWDGGPRDAYHIWISEIIMQQTRIEQGAPFYLRFIERFPSVEALASAAQDEVLRYWQGLGYYSRARNLHKTAMIIANDLKGVFPSSHDALMKLPGIGEYTAAAIASFAYNLPHPVVDGNVKRVLSRFSGFTSSIDESSSHQKIVTLAGKEMKGSSPAIFNQAIMNFGALVCTPKNPLCSTCVLSKKCYALKHNCIEALPLRTKKKTNTSRYFHFLVVVWKDKILMQKRFEKDIWQGLYTPLLVETKSTRKPAAQKLLSAISEVVSHEHIQHTKSTATKKQLLSHQTINGRFHFFDLLEKPKKLHEPFVWVSRSKLDFYPKPKMIAAVM
jgi:A/G-specific adenine glycosylase